MVRRICNSRSLCRRALSRLITAAIISILCQMISINNIKVWRTSLGRRDRDICLSLSKTLLLHLNNSSICSFPLKGEEIFTWNKKKLLKTGEERMNKGSGWGRSQRGAMLTLSSSRSIVAVTWMKMRGQRSEWGQVWRVSERWCVVRGIISLLLQMWGREGSGDLQHPRWACGRVSG